MSKRMRVLLASVAVALVAVALHEHHASLRTQQQLAQEVRELSAVSAELRDRLAAASEALSEQAAFNPLLVEALAADLRERREVVSYLGLCSRQNSAWIRRWAQSEQGQAWDSEFQAERVTRSEAHGRLDEATVQARRAWQRLETGLPSRTVAVSRPDARSGADDK